MSAFLQSIHFDKPLSEAQYGALDWPQKAICLVRQAFLSDYVDFFTSGSCKTLLEPHQRVLMAQVRGMQIIGHQPGDYRTPHWLVIAQHILCGGLANLSEHDLSGAMDDTYDELPLRVSSCIWRPYLAYRNASLAVRSDPMHAAQVPTKVVDQGFLPFLELNFRNIRIDAAGDATTTFTFDPANRLDALKANNIFGFLSCGNWTGYYFESLLSRLSSYALTSEKPSLPQYIRDCVMFDGRGADPASQITHYSIDGAHLQAFFTLLLTLKTRDYVGFDYAPPALLNRLLLADSTGVTTKRLSLPQVPAVLIRSTEALAAPAYTGVLHTLLMAKDPLSLSAMPKFDEADADTPPKKDAGKTGKAEDTGKTKDAGKTEDTGKKKDDEAFTDTEPPKFEDTDEEPAEEPAPESSPSKSDDEPGSQSDPDTSEADPTADDQDEVASSTTTKIGSLTVAPAEAPSLGTTLYRAQLQRYLDRILDARPKQFTAEELSILETLRVHWLFVYSIDTITGILDKVLIGKGIPKLELASKPAKTVPNPTP